MSLNEEYIIDTPENIEFRYTIAGIGSRFIAAIIDSVLLVMLQVALGVAFVFMISVAEETNIVGGGTASSIGVGLWLILSFVFLWGYYIFFELAWNGQSPGKRAVRLRVVREGGRPVTFVSVAIRNLVRIIDFLPMFYGLGVLVMFIDSKARRLGDFSGGTMVVKERQAVSLESLLTRAAPLPNRALQPREPGAQANLLTNIHLLQPNDYSLVQEFLRRRRELGKESRQRLGAQLAAQVRLRLGLDPADSPTANEAFLEMVVRDYRLAHQDQEAAAS